MLRIGFVTCRDLSRYFVSKTNPLLTHDDQVACDYLASRSCLVEPVVWGADVENIKSSYDMLIIRSPWDYMDSDDNRQGFINWLNELARKNVPVLNDLAIMQWSLDKHYLDELHQLGVRTVPTRFLEPAQNLDVLKSAMHEWKQIVVKPCISAAANDTFRILDNEELENFILGKNNFSMPFFEIQRQRSFMIQPYFSSIETEGEWSLVFLNEQYSHAILKKPKAGGWLVQDELGGSVISADAPQNVQEFGEAAFAKLILFIKARFFKNFPLLYARIDVMPGLFLGEIELVEPELFFLDRRNMRPNESALAKFYEGILACRSMLPSP